MSTKRRRNPVWRLRNRRGAVLVWFGISISAMLMVTAVVLDFAYWYAATQELQTAADAAALRGARMLQFTMDSDPADDVDTAAVNWSAMNEAQLDGVTITAGQVHLAWWNMTPPGGVPGEPILDPAAAGWPTDASGTKRKPNAVVVENGQLGKTLIGQIFGWNPPQLGRRAVAVIAYLNAGRCLRPWGMPMSQITWMVTNADDVTGQDSLYRELTPYEVAVLAGMTDAERTITMVPPEKTFETTQKPFPSAWPTANGEWEGFRLDNEATNTGNQGMDEFNRLSAGGCVTSGEAYGVGDYANTDLPAGSLNTKMQDAVEGGYGNSPNGEQLAPTCYQNEGSANCYADAGKTELGRIVNVAWTSSAGEQGTEPVQAYMLGQFKIMCLYEKVTDTCGHATPFSNTGYPPGTLVGMPIADFFTRLMPDYEWGNVPSTSSRLFLVK